MADQDVHAATTLTEMMRRRAALTPDKPYFHLYGETITYGRLWAVSARYAAGLARADLRAGDKLCLIYPTCAEFFYTFFGALRMGAVPVPLYPTLSVEATARIFNDSEAVAVATIGWFRKGVDESVAQAPRVRTVLEPPDLEADAPEPADAEPGEEDLAFLQYTSGSTGHPRGVMLTHRNVVATIKFMAEAAGLTAEDRVVSWLPLYHDMGLIGCAFTPPLTGTPLWLLPPDLRNPRQWLELITEVRSRSRPTSATETACATSAIPPGSTSRASGRRSPAPRRCARPPSAPSSRASASSASSRPAMASPRRRSP